MVVELAKAVRTLGLGFENASELAALIRSKPTTTGPRRRHGAPGARPMRGSCLAASVGLSQAKRKLVLREEQGK